MALWTNMAVKCFERCVATTNTRLTEGTAEYKCLENCVNKHVETNHRTVKNFTLLQEKFMKKSQDFENDKMKEYVEKGIFTEDGLELKPMRPKTQQEIEVETMNMISPKLGKAYSWFYDVPLPEETQ
jgi:hypothetical protein